MRLVIGSICAISLLGDNPWCATSAIYKKYRDIISKESKPLSYRRIVDLLVEVENSGLVVSRIISRGRHGYGNEYKLKLSPKMVGPHVGEQWWESVIEQKVAQDSSERWRKTIGSRSRFARSLLNSYDFLKKQDVDL